MKKRGISPIQAKKGRSGAGKEKIKRIPEKRERSIRCIIHWPQHFLNFLPLPQGQGSLRPTFGSSRLIGSVGVGASRFGGWGPLGDPPAWPNTPCGWAWEARSKAETYLWEYCCGWRERRKNSCSFSGERVLEKTTLGISSVMLPLISAKVSKASFLYAIKGSVWP